MAMNGSFCVMTESKCPASACHHREPSPLLCCVMPDAMSFVGVTCVGVAAPLLGAQVTMLT